MAKESDSVERIAADILIASLSQANAASAASSLEKPERVTKAYQAIHDAVTEAQKKRQPL